MFYKIKIQLLKFLKLSPIKSFLYNVLKVKTADDICKELIQKYAPEKSFADIGCMWRVNGLFSFLAEEYGARKILAVDIDKNNKFVEEKNRRNSKVEFLQGDIHLKETIDKIGLYDIVFCSGVLYHSPNPIHFLTQLRKICKETLILVTMLIPEMKTKNTAVFYPFLYESQKKLWDIKTIQCGINKPFNQNNEYANWFWGLTSSCVESMLKYSQFNIEERYIRPFQGFYVCTTQKLIRGINPRARP